MLPKEDLQQRWQQLQSSLIKQKGKEYTLDDLLILIGKQEAGWPPQKELTEKDKTDLLQLGICCILVPVKYYKLIWVDDFGWPHYQQMQPLPCNNQEERTTLLKEYILLYNERNKLVIESLPPVKK